MAFRADEDECTLTTDERRAEADRIIASIGMEAVGVVTPKEESFLQQMTIGNVSVKQLLWLRRIKDKLD